MDRKTIYTNSVFKKERAFPQEPEAPQMGNNLRFEE